MSQLVFALSESGNYDEQIWDILKKQISEKNFDYEVIKHARGKTTEFTTLSGKEHFFQAETTEFANKLFFQDKLAAFELYNGVKKASIEAPQLGLAETVELLEKKYSHLIEDNEKFLELDFSASQSEQLSWNKDLPKELEKTI